MVARKRLHCQQGKAGFSPEAPGYTSKSAAARAKMIAMPNHLYAGLLPPGHPPDKICISVPGSPPAPPPPPCGFRPFAPPSSAALGGRARDARVAALVEKSPEALFLYLGCVRAGAVFLPLNTAYTASEVDYFLGDARPTILVTDPARREGLSEIATAHGDPSRRDARPRMARARSPASPPKSRMAGWMSSAVRTISPRSSTRRAPPGARRARC